MVALEIKQQFTQYQKYNFMSHYNKMHLFADPLAKTSMTSSKLNTVSLISPGTLTLPSASWRMSMLGMESPGLPLAGMTSKS